MPAYKDQKSGTWYCKFYYKDWTGKRRQKWKRGFSTKRDATAFEKEFLEQHATGPDMTLKTMYERYISEMETRLKYSTLTVKKNIFITKILPYLGDKKVDEITPSDVRCWQNILIDQGYAPTYLRTVNNQLLAMMNYAERYYELQTNPCSKAGGIGNSKAREMQYWTMHEYLVFRENAKNTIKTYICFEILYWTGMRVGEMLALTREDINLSNRQISITKTFQRIAGEDIITKPKTERSIRRVSIPTFLCDELEIYVKSKDTSSDSERLFPFLRNRLAYDMKKICQRINLRKIRVHDLRHSHVSLLINSGFDALEIANRVGHEKVSTTMNVYAHLFPVKQERIVQTLERIGGDVAALEPDFSNTVNCGRYIDAQEDTYNHNDFPNLETDLPVIETRQQEPRVRALDVTDLSADIGELIREHEKNLRAIRSEDKKLKETSSNI